MVASYSVRVRDPAGTVYATLNENAADTHPTKFDPYVEGLNDDVGSFSFALPCSDPAVVEVTYPPYVREVEVLRNGTVVWPGPITQWRIADSMCQVRCGGLLEHFNVRPIDRPSGRINYLLNPDFEAGTVGGSIPNWTASGVTAVTDNAHSALGSKSAKLTQASGGTDTYIHQVVSVGAGPIGALMTFTAWAFIDNAAWAGAAVGELGLLIRQTTGPSAGTGNGFGTAQLRYSTPRGEWVMFQAATEIPPSVSGLVVDIDCILMAPGGITWWDATSLTAMESLGFTQQDQTAMAQQIIAFLQNTSYGWDDLHIPQVCPTSGVIRDRAYQFTDHVPPVTQALAEFPTLQDGFDFGITPTDRTFRTWFPRRGTDRTGTVTLTNIINSGDGGNCLLTSFLCDGPQAGDSISALGPGSGPGRVEGFYQDTTAFSGRVVRRVISPPGNPPISALAGLAQRAHYLSSKPYTAEVEVVDTTVASTVGLGDTVAGTFTEGSFTRSGNWRVMRRAVDPATDRPTLSLSPA